MECEKSLSRYDHRIELLGDEFELLKLKIKENSPSRDMNQEIELMEKLSNLTWEFFKVQVKRTCALAPDGPIFKSQEFDFIKEKFESLEHQLRERIQLNGSNRENRLTKEIGSLKCHLEETEKELEDTKKDLEKMKKDLQNMDRAATDFVKENFSLKHQLQQANIASNQKENKFSRADTLVKEKDKEIQRLKAETKELRCHLEETKRELESMERKARDFINESVSLKNQLQQVAMELIRRDGELKKVTEELGDKEKSLSDMAAKFLETNTLIKRKDDEIHDRIQEISRLSNKINVLELEHHEKDEQLMKKDEQLKEKNMELGARDDVIHHLIDKAKSLEHQHLSELEKNAAIDRMTQKLKKAEKSLNSKGKLIKRLISGKKVKLLEELVGENFEKPEEADESIVF